jgi:FKBP-type peptidyl-prolyl cis-trans isomerase FkpA
MRLSLVRSPRRSAAVAAVLALSALLTTGCTLGGSTELPPLTDPASVSYAASTGVTSLATMTRLNESVYIRDSVVGTGRTVLPNDSVSVYYTGQLNSGATFDANSRPAAPISFPLDTLRLIRGWVTGLPNMKVGGIRRLVVGPASGYAYNTLRDGANNVLIPPNSVLVFLVEVVDARTR